MQNITFTATDITNTIIHQWPIEPASKVEYVGKGAQAKSTKKLAHCPGMHDYSNVGWIMRAWDDIHIFCSESSSMAYYGDPKILMEKNRGEGPLPHPSQCPHLKPANAMDGRIIDGYEGRDNTFIPLHCTSPWRMEGDISLICYPPVYHSDISQYIDIFPGIVDYSDKFHAINFIFSPRKQGTYVIKAGTPILHLIPIQKGSFTCDVQRSKPGDLESLNALPGRINQFYRKLFMKKSKYEVNVYNDKA